MKSRYEELRQRAMQVETATGPSRWGPALLIRYGMARLSAYPNTMFVLCLEWQEGWSSTEVRT